MNFFDLLSKIKSLFYTSNIKVVMDRKWPNRFFWGRGLLFMFWDGEKHIKNSEMGSSKKTHFAYLVVVYKGPITKKLHFKIAIFSKFTIPQSQFSQNTEFQNLNFPKTRLQINLLS